MKWLLVVLAALVAIGAIVLLTGSMIAREHRATSRIVIERPAAEVWPVVRDFAALPGFWPQMAKVERLPDRNGVEVWKQTMKNGFDLPLLVTEDAPPRRLVTTIDAPAGSPFGGRWIYELEPTGAGTQVTVTEDGWIDNKLFRVVSRVTGYHGTLDSYLKALGTRLGATVTPVHVP